MGYHRNHSYHDGYHGNTEHLFSFDNDLKIGFDLKGPDLTVDAYTNFSDPTAIAQEKAVAQFLGKITDPYADPHRFDKIDGTDHFTINVNTQTGVADVNFQESSQYQFEHKAAEPFPTQEFLNIISGGDPTHPEYYSYGNTVKAAVGTDQSGTSLKVDAYTNITDPTQIALEKQVLAFAGPLIDPKADPHQFDKVDGTDHFTFTFDTKSGTADLAFQDTSAADFAEVNAGPFPADEILALLNGDTPKGGDCSYGDTGGQSDNYGWQHDGPWHHHADHSGDLVYSG
jgi:hypothetical protein